MTNYPHPIIQQALELLACEIRQTDALASPDAVKDYLRLKLAPKDHEVFAVVFLDCQHRVIEFEEMFRGTLTQTSVYPRELVRAAMVHNCAAVILCHNHPSGSATPSRADEMLTQTLKTALALVDVRVLDHLIVTTGEVLSMAERGLM
jgi:DNA repair protein RadC